MERNSKLAEGSQLAEGSELANGSLPAEGSLQADGSQLAKGSIAVIGAGIIGICTALEFQRVGYQVTLIDKGEPAAETSKGNASFIAVEAMEPQATKHNILSAIKLTFHENAAFKVTPDNLLGFIPWGIKFLKEAQKLRVNRSRDATLRLHKYTVAAWTDLLERTGNLDMMYNCGYLKVWENESDLEKVKKHQVEMQGHGFECEVISGTAIFEKEPALSRNIKHALFFPNTLQLLEPHQTALKLFDYFIQQGGDYKQAEVSKLTTQKVSTENSVNINTSSGNLNFDKAVVCMGAWSKKLCEEVTNDKGEDSGLKIPLVPERGYHLTYPNSPVKFKHLIKSEDRHLVLTPLSTGMRVTGFGEFSKIMSKPIEKRYPQLNKHMNGLIENMQADKQQPTSWMGRRPTLPDSLPVIDLHPQYPQIGMVFGHQHLGLTQSPISAKIISAMFEGDKENETLKNFEDIIDAFSVTRF